MRFNRFVFLNLPMLSLETHLGVTTSPQDSFPADFVTLPVSGKSPPLRLTSSRSRRRACSKLHAFHPCSSAVSPSKRRGSTTSRRTVGDVGNPQFVGIFRIKAPIHQIHRLLRSLVAHRGDYEPMRPHPLQMRGTHQSRHTFAADADTVVIGELRMDHR
jgi:hypothetical protein